MKKNYLRPEAKLHFPNMRLLLEITSDDEFLGKERDGEYSSGEEGGDSPIWGEGGKLW